ncbi:3568_t:CDS:2, partial [Diversispora eburnea]
CADAQICQDGKCVCPNGNTFCSPTCVDTTSDIQNCGSCGNICPSDNVCVNGACVDCAVNSDCVSDWLLNPETGEAIGAAGTCIDNVCYVCADGCLSQSYCSSFETTGGGAPALCKTDSSCDYFRIGISGDDGETKSSSFTDGVPLWHQDSLSFI